MQTQALTIAEINHLDRDTFVARLGFLFEGSPWVADAAWPARPFADASALHRALCAAMYAAPAERQIALIRAHPDLAGKAAVAGELTAESTREQTSAGLSQLSAEEFARFTQLNQAYRERFEFPFVICAREHTKASILNQFVLRLQNSRAQEIQAALAEIAKIAKLRLLDLVASDEWRTESFL
jgi:2-oxo-4-hydroxy-4-carboxy-5-ureidoimidazoline decarboxylase